MADLVYSVMTSLDGYLEDEQGDFSWAAPGADVHQFVNDLTRPVGTFLFGRRMYETMLYWETAPTGPDADAVAVDFTRIWQAADKVVYSRTLEEPFSARTRIEPDFDPARVQDLKAGSERDLAVGGAELGAQAIAAGLVDEIQLFLSPIVVGGGKPALPSGVTMALDLVDERRFDDGTVFLRYRTRR